MTLDAPTGDHDAMVDVYNPSDTAIHIQGKRVDGGAHAELRDTRHLRDLEAAGVITVNRPVDSDPEDDDAVTAPGSVPEVSTPAPAESKPKSRPVGGTP